MRDGCLCVCGGRGAPVGMADTSVRWGGEQGEDMDEEQARSRVEAELERQKVPSHGMAKRLP